MTGESPEQVKSHLEALIYLLTGLGFVINIRKSITTPAQQIEYLGLLGFLGSEPVCFQDVDSAPRVFSYVYKILLSSNNLQTSSVHWPLNTSNMRAGWLLLSPSCSYIWKYNPTNEVRHGGGVWAMISRMCNIPSFWKFDPLRQTSCSSSFVY